MMAAAINQDDDLSSEEIRPEIAALLATVERLTTQRRPHRSPSCDVGQTMARMMTSSGP
jgi:hypothetical protein